jgi:clan AA aspartic protease (TIGR02281 family)
MKHILLTAALLCGVSEHAMAIVGGTPDNRFSDRVAMVLTRDGGSAAFCSALVLNSRTLLTAAQCMRPLRDMAVHYRDASGAAIIIPIDAAIAHPRYHPNAIKDRVESIDVAIVHTARPLGPHFIGGSIDGEIPAVGEQVIISGYGATIEGNWEGSGILRIVTLPVGEPASTVLIWARATNETEAGACSGDSGGPIWSADGKRVVAISTWAQAKVGKGCGGLTQGPWLAPIKGWIEESERRMGEPTPPVIAATPTYTAPVSTNSVPLTIEHNSAYASVMLGSQQVTMLIDTGATGATVTESIANKLVNSSQASELSGGGTSTLADGTVHDVRLISINTVIIGGHEVHNVHAGVSPNNADMLLGMSVLRQIFTKIFG